MSRSQATYLNLADREWQRGFGRENQLVYAAGQKAELRQAVQVGLVHVCLLDQASIQPRGIRQCKRMDAISP